MTSEYAHCQRCDKTVRPVCEMQLNGRVMDVCPSCQAPVTTSEPAQAPTPPKIVGGTVRTVVIPAAAAAPVDILAMARVRLATLESELDAMEAKFTEAAMLRRMIEAAELPAHESHPETH